MKRIVLSAAVMVCATLLLPRLAAAQTATGNPSVDHHAGQSRDPHRHARFQGRRAEQGDPRQGLRRPRLRARAARVRGHLSGRQHPRDPQGPAERRRQGQRGHHLLRVDGCQVAVADHQCRHDLRRRRARSHQGPHGAGDRAAFSRRHPGLLVSLDHRHRTAGPISRRRRKVPDRAARLRRSAAGRRVRRRPLPDQLRHVVRPVVPGEPQRSQAGGRHHPEVHQDLPLRGRRPRHTHRRVPGRQSPVRPEHAAEAGRVPRRQRQGDRTPFRPTTSASSRCSTRSCSRSRPPRSTPS